MKEKRLSRAVAVRAVLQRSDGPPSEEDGRFIQEQLDHLGETREALYGRYEVFTRAMRTPAGWVGARGHLQWLLDHAYLATPHLRARLATNAAIFEAAVSRDMDAALEWLKVGYRWGRLSRHDAALARQALDAIARYIPEEGAAV